MVRMISVALLGLLLLTAPACSKKDDKAKDKADQGGKPDKADPGGKPDLAAIKAIDCKKACDGMFDCNTKIAEKFKQPAPAEDTRTGCMAGCDALKSDMGSDEMKLETGPLYLDYAAGKCDL